MNKLLKLKVSSIWNGKVAIRDKYLHQMFVENKGLEIYHKLGVMIIPTYKEVLKRIVARSEQPVKDRFGKGSHYLVYFDWQPSVRQMPLFPKNEEKELEQMCKEGVFG